MTEPAEPQASPPVVAETPIGAGVPAPARQGPTPAALVAPRALSRSLVWSLAIFYSLSLCLFSAVPISHDETPRRTPHAFTDHEAHWGSSILLWFYGFDIYRRPINQLCSTAPTSDPGVAPAVTCALPDHPSIRTFAANWTAYPRVYPPGAMLFGAPSALLYTLTSASFSTANLVFVLQCILAAHVLSLLLFLCLWQLPAPEDPSALVSRRAWNGCVLLFLMPTLHLHLVAWSVFGIYDAVALCGVVAGAILLARDRPVAATLALSAAIFLHFRALWYLPLLVYAFFRATRVRQTRGSLVALLAACAMLALAAAAFFILLPVLRTFPVNNMSHWAVLAKDPSLVVVRFLPVLCILAVLLWNRQWMLSSVAIWQMFMLLQTREVRTWHAESTWPLVGIAALEKRAAPIAVLLALLLVVIISRNWLMSWPIGGELLKSLFGTLDPAQPNWRG